MVYNGHMAILPSIRCPQCGRKLGPVTAKVIPPAEKFKDCLRRCGKCRIGATNAKNPAKVRFIASDKPPKPPLEKGAAPAGPQADEPAPAEPKPPETPQ